MWYLNELIMYHTRKKVFHSELVYLFAIPGRGEPPPDPPSFHRDALMRMGTHDKPKRYKRRSSMLEVFHVVDRMLMKTHLFVVMYTKEIVRERRL